MKILIIALSGIGDLIMAFPMIKLLKKEYNTKIDFLVAPRGTKELLENQPFVNNIYVLNALSFKDLLINIITDKKIRKLFSELKSNNYDIAITIFPPQGIFSALLMKIIGAKIRIQHKYRFKIFNKVDWFLTHSIDIVNTHSVYENMNLLKCLGIEYKENNISYTYKMSEDQKRFLNSFWNKYNLHQYFIIGIHPGTGKDQPWKRWDINNWVKLIYMINKDKKDIKFLIFLGPDEIEYKKYFEKIKNVIIVHNLELKYVISIISKCNLFISNDSGLSHIASLFELPQIVLFMGGPDPKNTQPFSNYVTTITPNNYIPYYHPYYSFSKGYKKIRNKEEKISVENVYREVLKHLRNSIKQKYYL